MELRGRIDITILNGLIFQVVRKQTDAPLLFHKFKANNSEMPIKQQVSVNPKRQHLKHHSSQFVIVGPMFQ